MSPLDRERYATEGAARWRLPEEVLALRDALRAKLERLVARVAGPLGAPLEDAAVSLDRTLLDVATKGARRLPEAKRLAAHAFFVERAGALMGTELVSCCHFVHLRFDRPDGGRIAPPHQDFPYIQGSLDGLTIWLPLGEIAADMGAPAWIAGSHRFGPLPVRERALEEVGGDGNRVYELADDPRVTSAAWTAAGAVAADECLVFHTLLVHKSDPNRSARARLSLQLRFDDLADAESIRRRYPEGLYLRDSLRRSYPHLVRGD